MRRMIPQKFSDWIKNIKDKLFVNSDGDVAVDGELVVDGSNSSAKKIYWHTVYFERKAADVYFFNGILIVLNNDPTPITAQALYDLLNVDGFYGIVFHGFREGTAGATQPSSSSNPVKSIKKGTSDHQVVFTYIDSNNQDSTTSVNWTLAQISVTDLGVNAIN